MLYVVILYLRELSLIHIGVPQGFDKYNIQYFLSIKLIFVLKLFAILKWKIKKIKKVIS